jgi:hypothetical protein
VLLTAGATLGALAYVSRAQGWQYLNCLQGDRTPLHIACERGHAEVVSVLLTAGAVLESQDQVSAVGGDEMIDESESYSL